MIYVDNMLVKTDTKSEHLVALEQMFIRLKTLNIKCRKEKCTFMVQAIRTMGFVVEHGKILPDPLKIDMLLRTPEPNSRQDLRAFLGLLQFYRDMLPHLAHTAHLLYAATSDNFQFQWTGTLARAFKLTKTMLIKSIMNNNLEGPEDIQVFVDASKYAVCVVVMQKKRIITCASKVLSPSQRRWATIERELYAIAWGLKKMRFYLHGVKFQLYTDHKPLVGFFSKVTDAPNTRMMALLLATMEYSFDVNYLPGVRNVIADYGSRYIDHSEWDKPQPGDADGIHELFAFTMDGNVDIYQHILVKEISEADLHQLQLVKLSCEFKNNLITVQIKNRAKYYVPIDKRRTLFWLLHKDLHEGSTKLLEALRTANLYWPLMQSDIEKFLSQCFCTNKKSNVPHKYSEKVPITADYPLHILAIDLYGYGESLYFTALDICTRFSWVSQVEDKQPTTILKVYQRYIQHFAEPTWVSCDNGAEFNLIATKKTSHSSEHPQSNGVIERFHLELGKLARVFESTPDQVYQKLNTEQSTAQFHSHLGKLLLQPVNCAMTYTTRKLHYNELVWRLIPKRRRTKAEDTFSGPHRILNKVGKFSYELTSHLNRVATMQVNINDLKKMHIPDTRSWQLNPHVLREALEELGTLVTNPDVLLDFHAIGSLVTDIMQGRTINVDYFVVPDWPCMEWYKPLHEYVTAEAVKLPAREDLFLSDDGQPLGRFAWDHWLFKLERSVVEK
jgi:hypothetical protein